VIGLLQAPLGWAQTVAIPPDANPPLTFDVIAIKPANPNTQGGGVQIQPGGGLNFSNISAHFILTFAYDIRDFQLFGEPGWMKTERYDIKTKADGGAPGDMKQMNDALFRKVDYQMKQRTRSMLAERFQLKFHRETRELPVYALVLAKGGHKLKANNGDTPPNMRMNRGLLTSQRMPIQNLCNALANQLGRPVVNHTGLDGNFDYKLEWTPDPSPSIPGDSAEGTAASDPGGPSLSAALLEQLGLRLESKKAPVEVIVIDRVTKPTEN
jgi:uncharacterized protein (TIGR03435 family)